MHAIIWQEAIPTFQKHVHFIVTPILVFQLFLSSFVCDQNFFSSMLRYKNSMSILAYQKYQALVSPTTILLDIYISKECVEG